MYSLNCVAQVGSRRTVVLRAGAGSALRDCASLQVLYSAASLRTGFGQCEAVGRRLASHVGMLFARDCRLTTPEALTRSVELGV